MYHSITCTVLDVLTLLCITTNELYPAFTFEDVRRLNTLLQIHELPAYRHKVHVGLPGHRTRSSSEGSPAACLLSLGLILNVIPRRIRSSAISLWRRAPANDLRSIRVRGVEAGLTREITSSKRCACPMAMPGPPS